LVRFGCHFRRRFGGRLGLGRCFGLCLLDGFRQVLVLLGKLFRFRLDLGLLLNQLLQLLLHVSVFS